MSVTAPTHGGQPADAVERKPSRKRLLIAIGIVAVVAGIAWGVRWWTVGRFVETTDDAYLKADSVTIAPKVSGYITEVLVADNQAVEAGAPLARLDTRQYQASLDQAKAALDARAADIDRAEAELKQQHANADQAKAQAEVSRVSLAHAEDDVNRYRPLVATGAETAERLASLVSTRDQARATLAANLAAARSASTQIGATEAQIAQARAQVEAAQAQLNQSKLDLSDTTLVSPVAGRVGDRTVRVGQYVQPGTRLMTVVPVEALYLEANFKETQVGRMRVGQPATLHVDALKGTELHGVVESFAPGTGAQFALLPPENATGNFTKIVQRVPVRIRVDTGPQTRKVLLPGLSVTVDVDTKTATDDSHRIAAENRHD
ncbi:MULTISPECIES: HlyD family secretion protein [Caballeronia]|jgi:membrane fusion protein (multidrug efflux system)|uniref:Multidrug ABC transporter permease n=1 Tax=Caballeronia zhejiangensis TaxID=871203 RepID=A0A656QBC0_9BURK|nr:MULTISPECIES: HlyD family secretion protein [Caballeronia]EKS71242.1 multidrug resistance efflux pump [Burkholderia sp. SJ98]KDR25245.1 multidrug ABC transporter permease [Caballeronia zhejiangensis]MDR5766599.1 HlyD family secretion protein [Caballeronia sp. LZ028]MDR5790626.1 HlyD family secretion protein [Caballeronia sp. LP003]MDR5798478.1 HlyD family secretion protein [Caballeronia sp. LZ008]